MSWEGNIPKCDRCGVTLPSDSVYDCSIVSDLDPNRPGHIRNMHFCRDKTKSESAKKGCTESVLTPRNTEYWLSVNKEEPTDVSADQEA